MVGKARTNVRADPQRIRRRIRTKEPAPRTAVQLWTAAIVRWHPQSPAKLGCYLNGPTYPFYEFWLDLRLDLKIAKIAQTNLRRILPRREIARTETWWYHAIRRLRSDQYQRKSLRWSSTSRPRRPLQARLRPHQPRPPPYPHIRPKQIGNVLAAPHPANSEGLDRYVIIANG